MYECNGCGALTPSSCSCMYYDILRKREAKDREIVEAEKRLALLKHERDDLKRQENDLWWQALPRRSVTA